jgi:hypothetical protein
MDKSHKGLILIKITEWINPRIDKFKKGNTVS